MKTPWYNGESRPAYNNRGTQHPRNRSPSGETKSGYSPNMLLTGKPTPSIDLESQLRSRVPAWFSHEQVGLIVKAAKGFGISEQEASDMIGRGKEQFKRLFLARLKPPWE